MPDWRTIYTIAPSVDSTVALEIEKTGWMRGKKHLLFFEDFRGELCYVPESPEASRLEMKIEANSVVCRDRWLSARLQAQVTSFARRDALDAERHPEIRFASTRVSAKPLRGFVIAGVLTLRGIGRNVRVNVVIGPMKKGRFQVDGDAALKLTDFGIKPPSHLLGLAGTKDEALLRLLLWATEPTAVT
jgi:polyisoprenoid-binding protein YceI